MIYPYKIYNDLLGNRIALSVIKLLNFAGSEMTGREVASSVGYSPQAVLESLNLLERLVLVTSKKAGRAKLYKVNSSHWFVASALASLWKEIDGWIQSLGEYYVRRLKSKPVSIIMYGSFARGEATSESDMDLLFVFKEAVPDILDDLLSLNSDIYLCYGVHPSPKVSTVSEAKEKVIEKDGFVRNVFIEGKRIFGITPSEVMGYDSEKD